MALKDPANADKSKLLKCRNEMLYHIREVTGIVTEALEETWHLQINQTKGKASPQTEFYVVSSGMTLANIV